MEGCSPITTETSTTKLNVSQNDYGAEITVVQDNITIEKTAEMVFKDYLKLLEEKTTSESHRIKDYRIESIKIEKENDTGFTFSVSYSILPASEHYILAGNGVQEDNNWIVNKFNFVEVTKKDNRFRITQISTGK